MTLLERDEKASWQQFLSSGSVADYLNYVRNSRNGDDHEEDDGRADDLGSEDG